MIRITETIRDALQGIQTYVPTRQKLEYTNLLLRAGFDLLDVGSFVSPKLIPQMADTAELVAGIDKHLSSTRIMTLVVNSKGVEQAMEFPVIEALSYPFAVSPTFLKRNLNTSPELALKNLSSMISLTAGRKINWVVYLSMGLGNPYGDPWSADLVVDAAATLYDLGIRSMPLSDILGLASPETIFDVYEKLIPSFPDVDFGLHLHTKPSESFIKLEAAWDAGVRSYETALGGLGGCPTAASEMVGNLNTLSLLQFCRQKNISTPIDEAILQEALLLTAEFPVDKLPWQS
jgi:hydroxymethylglutaryl-CoA lyase